MRLGTLWQRMPALAPTIIAFVLLVAIGGYSFDGFISGPMLTNLLTNQAPLGIIVVGMSFVIISGGIDLSVGALMAMSSMLFAASVERLGLPSYLAIPFVLAIGTLCGALSGKVICSFDLPPFIVTLAAMFLFRGLSLSISREPIVVRDAFIAWTADVSLPLGLFEVEWNGLLLLLFVGLGIFVSRYTRFGRRVYAIGGDEAAARQLGIAVDKTKKRVYAISGFCSAFAGVVSVLYLEAGDPAMSAGFELDAIAAVVVGGAFLAGGVGGFVGTFLGVLVFGVIQELLNFEGTLGSGWVRVAVGVLLLLFLLVQRVSEKSATSAA